jgi:hypothetical protein
MSLKPHTPALWLIALIALSPPSWASNPSKSKPESLDSPGSHGVRSLHLCSDSGTLHQLTGRYHPDQNPAFTLDYMRSSDGGTTWSSPVALPTATHPPGAFHRGSDARIAAHGNHLVAIWSEAGTGAFGGGPMASALSDDAGKTWKSGPNPADDGLKDGHGFVGLNADPLGRFHLAWLDSRTGDRGLRYASSDDFGNTWTVNRTAVPKTCECCWNTLTPLGDGSVGILFRARTPRDMQLVRSTDSGKTWLPPVPIANFQWDFNSCPHVGGGLATSHEQGSTRVHAAIWTGAPGKAGLYYAASNDHGQSWAEPRKIGAPLAWHPDLASDGKNRVVIVWDSMAGLLPEVSYSASSDNGQTWSPPARLSPEGKPATHPQVVHSNGHFNVFWTTLYPDRPATTESAHIP